MELVRAFMVAIIWQPRLAAMPIITTFLPPTALAGMRHLRAREFSPGMGRLNVGPVGRYYCIAPQIADRIDIVPGKDFSDYQLVVARAARRRGPAIQRLCPLRRDRHKRLRYPTGSSAACCSISTLTAASASG